MHLEQSSVVNINKYNEFDLVILPKGFKAICNVQLFQYSAVYNYTISELIILSILLNNKR